jgi:hypothetical protein
MSRIELEEDIKHDLYRHQIRKEDFKLSEEAEYFRHLRADALSQRHLSVHQNGYSVMIFDAEIDKPALDGHLVKKCLEYYDKLK